MSDGPDTGYQSWNEDTEPDVSGRTNRRIAETDRRCSCTDCTHPERNRRRYTIRRMTDNIGRGVSDDRASKA